jgi:hypothetical protein
MTEPNPTSFAHSLEWVGANVFLITRQGDHSERRNMGRSELAQGAYRVWKHMRDAHSQEHADVYLSGLMAGMGIALWEDLESEVNRISKERSPKHNPDLG